MDTVATDDLTAQQPSLATIREVAATAGLFTDIPQQIQQAAASKAVTTAKQKKAPNPAKQATAELMPAMESDTCTTEYAGKKPVQPRELRISLQMPDLTAGRAGEPVVPAVPNSAPVPAPRKLTLFQMAFVDALLRSPTLDVGSAHEKAALRVPRRPGTAEDVAVDHVSAGRQMYNKPAVQDELARRRRYHEEAVDAQAVQLEHGLARIAFADIRQLYDDQGGLLLPHQIPDDLAAAIVGMEEEDYVSGKGEHQEVGVRRKFKLADKLSAQKTLLQRRRLIQDDSAAGGIVAHFHIDLT